MSQRTAKFVPLTDPGKNGGSVFQGGIIDNSRPWMIPYKNSPYARNFRVSGRGIETRLGFSQFGDDLAASGNPVGIAAYYRSVVADDRIVVRFDADSTHKLVSVHPTTGAQTSVSTGANIASANPMNFVSANDSLYCMNGSDEMGKLNGTTYSVPSLGVTLKPSFGAWFDNSLFVAGDPANPTRLYKSNANNPESFTGGDSDQFDSSYPVNGLASAAQTLYVFSENSIDMINNNSIKQIGSSLVYTSLPLESMEGASGHRTIAVFGRDVYFLSKSGKIKKVAPGQALHYDVKELSHRANRGITKTMDSLDPDQSDAFAYVVPESNLIKWHLKSRGSPFNDLCVVYNTEYDEFMVDTQKVFSIGTNYKSKNFTASQIEPKIFLDEYGHTDDGAPIQFRYDTKVMNFGEPTVNKCLWQIRTFLALNRLGEVTQRVYADGSLVDTKTLDVDAIPQSSDGIGTEAVGTYAIGTDGFTPDDLYDTVLVRDKGYLRVRAKTFQLSYVSSKLGSRVLLQFAEPQIESLPFLSTSHY